MENNECIFCKIAKGELKSEIIDRTDNFIAIRDANPISEGHALIIPKKHFVTLLDVPNNFGEELLMFIKKISGKLLDDKYGDGFNILMNNLEVAGQVVMHAHVHIIPRKEDDGLKIAA